MWFSGWWKTLREIFEDLNSFRNIGVRGHCDVAIVVALKEEFRELYAELPSQLAPNRRRRGPYYEFTRRTNTGARYRCVAACSGEMGEKGATRTTERLIAKYQPKTIVVLGIAAGLDADVCLCDVAVATSVESYLDNSKAVESSTDSTTFDFQLAGETYRPTDRLRQELDNIEFKHSRLYETWQERCSEDVLRNVTQLASLVDTGVIRKAPCIVSGKFASGPTVGAAKQFISYLKQHDRKLLVLEMESGGVLSSIDTQPETYDSLVLRGISDFGDDRKKELDERDGGVFRKVAMRNVIGLLWAVLDAGCIPMKEPPDGEASSAIYEPLVQDVLDAGDVNPLPGCEVKSVGVRIDDVLGVIDVLKKHYDFEWEPGSFQGSAPVVYWPVRLRQPTIIHAAQTFAAAALARHGAQVILYLDDLGNPRHTPQNFFGTIKRWCRRVGVEAKFEERQFSHIVRGNNSVDAWPYVQKWLGVTQRYLLDILKISKIVSPEETEDTQLSVLAKRRPRRLLAPAVNWACLAQIQEEYSGYEIVTLGGADEKSLWSAWRSSIAEGDQSVGHLYNPSLGKVEEPVHMAAVNLGWDSRNDIKQALEEGVGNDSDDWREANRIIPWCLMGCVSLPDFVLSNCSRVTTTKVQQDTDPVQLIEKLADRLDDRLLRP